MLITNRLGYDDWTLKKPMKPERAAELMGMFDELFRTEGVRQILGCVSDALGVSLSHYQSGVDIPEPLTQLRNEYFETYDTYLYAERLMEAVLRKLDRK